MGNDGYVRMKSSRIRIYDSDERFVRLDEYEMVGRCYFCYL